MKITILGCGALGQLWLSRLYQQGPRCTGMAKSAAAFCAVNVIEPEGVSFNRNLPTNDPQHLAQSELLLVTLKAWQVSSAVSALLPKLNPQCAILLLHNGMGTQEELPPNGQPILQGTTTHAARHEGSTIIHVATGITHIGPTSPAAQHPQPPGGSAASGAARRCLAQQHRLGQLAQAGGQLRDQPADGAVRLP